MKLAEIIELVGGSIPSTHLMGCPSEDGSERCNCGLSQIRTLVESAPSSLEDLLDICRQFKSLCDTYWEEDQYRRDEDLSL